MNSDLYKNQILNVTRDESIGLIKSKKKYQKITESLFKTEKYFNSNNKDHLLYIKRDNSVLNIYTPNSSLESDVTFNVKGS